jgi:hypothetical protein
VDFPGAEHYTDAGWTPWERQQNLNELAGFLRQEAQRYLPEGQTLKVEFKDVDLAGEQHPRSSGRDLRIVRGRADWPRFLLHYTLQGPQGVIREGDAALQDMDYANATPSRFSNESLGYEKRLLDRWMKAQVAQGHAS